MLDQAEKVAEQLPVEVRDNAFQLYVDDSEYVVLTDQEPQTGEATVTGTVIEPGRFVEHGFIFAESV